MTLDTACEVQEAPRGKYDTRQRQIVLFFSVYGKTYERVDSLNQTGDGPNWLKDAELAEVEII